MSRALNWQSPVSKSGSGGLIHLLSSHKLNDGTRLTACSARITEAWSSTSAAPTCSNCIRLSASE